MHRNFYTVTANNYYELGLKQGKLFGEYSHVLLRKQSDWEQKTAVANRLVDLHKRHFPDYMQELEGYAKGAEMPFLELFTLAIEDDAEPVLDVGAKCTTIYSHDARLIGHNEDVAYNDGGNELCLLRKVINGVATVEVFYLSTLGGTALGLNSFGVVQAINTLINAPKRTDGLLKAFIARKMLDAQNPRGVYESLLVEKRKSGFNHNVFTVSQESYGIEFDALNPILRQIKSNYVHTNHQLADSSVNTTNEVAGTLTRLEYATNHVSQISTVEQMKELLLDQTLGPDKSILLKSNVANTVIDLQEQIIYVRLLREAEMGWQTYSFADLFT
jgi:hypothetical protein